MKKKKYIYTYYDFYFISTHNISEVREKENIKILGADVVFCVLCAMLLGNRHSFPCNHREREIYKYTLNVHTTPFLLMVIRINF